MRYVDYVVPNDDLTHVELVKAIIPSVYVTTSDNGPDSPEAKAAIIMGGKVAIIDKLPNYSTTKIADLVIQSTK